MWNDPRAARLITLIRAALGAPAGAGRIALALTFGALCHARFDRYRATVPYALPRLTPAKDQPDAQ